ncbi:MAG: GNAT family N-acetyltransferase [Rhodobacteraceae bacterium]|nr:GNAT family N-acetyltransferase [Paracoccaceae bacterium]
MKITSKGILSDFIFHEYNGKIRDHGEFIEARIPTNPDFYYGNFLVFPDPPNLDDVNRWSTLFDRIFNDDPRIRHKVFMWEPFRSANSAVIAEFERRGYKFDVGTVLATHQTVAPKGCPDDVVFRPLASDSDWKMALENQVRCRDSSYEEQGYRSFKTVRMATYRNMQNEGLGYWYGAFRDQVLVADMGIFHDNGVSRFQNVGTDPAHRRQGICAAMVHYVSTETRQKRPGNTLIIIADRGEPAERIYRGLGFKLIETLESVMLRPVSEST